MKKLYILILAAALVAAACQQEDQLRLEQLQQELSELNASEKGLPEAVTPASPSEQGVFGFVFDRDRYGVDAAGSVTVSYTLPEAATVEVSAKDGWSAVLNADGAGGTIVVTAPDPASPSDVVVTATTEDGRHTAAILPVMVRDPYTEATRTDVAALAYYCLTPSLSTDYHFKMLADGGFNMLTIEQVDNWQEQLTLAHKYGLKGVLFVNGVAGKYYHSHGTDTEIDAVINEAKTYPALAAYQIFDEPSTINIGQITFEKNRIEELDPDHPVYVNLHPASASKNSLGVDDYFEYVETFVTECNLKFITFDQYPVFVDGIDRSWPRSLEAVSRSAKKHGIPFWAFTLCCREYIREDPNLENIRLQNNTNLLYGAQVNQFFVYRSTSGTDYAPLQTWEYRPDGSRDFNVVKYTAAYDACKAYNTEMHNRGYIFSDCKVKKLCNNNVLHGWNENLNQNDLLPYIGGLSTDQEALISFIENKGNQYIAVMNCNWKAPCNVSAHFNDMVYSIDHDGVFTEHPGGSDAVFSVEAGDMIVFKVE